MYVAVCIAITWPPHVTSRLAAFCKQGTPAAGPQFSELRGPLLPRTVGTKRSHSRRRVAERMSRREQRRLQEAWRKRRRCRGEAPSAARADCVEPTEVDPPEDQGEPMEAAPPPARLPWPHYTRPPLTTARRHQRRSARPAPCHRPSPRRKPDPPRRRTKNSNSSSEEVRETALPLQKQATAGLPGRSAGLRL